jgi:hypothetical protein
LNTYVSLIWRYFNEVFPEDFGYVRRQPFFTEI